MKGPDGLPHPFHLYSMRQAIEEGFILDVLQNYMTYRPTTSLRRRSRTTRRSRRRRRSGRSRATPTCTRPPSARRWRSSSSTSGGMSWGAGRPGEGDGGHRSRESAMRYYLGMKEYIEEQGYDRHAGAGGVLRRVEGRRPDLDGTGDQRVLGERNCRASSTRRTEYRLLIVAEKYQTGFDQPKLCAMYVDRKLAGLQAVQTLSRLNRTAPGKRRPSSSTSRTRSRRSRTRSSPTSS